MAVWWMKTFYGMFAQNVGVKLNSASDWSTPADDVFKAGLDFATEIASPGCVEGQPGEPRSPIILVVILSHG